MNCAICGRELTNPESIEAGMGPVCRAANADLTATESEMHMEYLEIPLDDEHGVVLKRTVSGVATNVPWLVVDHSPDGFEWGYGGSGPADLALNILEAVLRQMGHKGEKISVFRGKCFRLAHRLHQDFKWKFISIIDREDGGTIPMREIKAFIAKALVKQQQEGLF
jgi:hypothetical protein